MLKSVQNINDSLTFENSNQVKTTSNFLPEVQDLVSCNFCDFDTSRQEDLDKHSDILHGQSEQFEQPGTVELKSILTLDYPRQETDTIVNIADVNNTQIDSIIICGECGKGFDDESQFSMHMPIHDSPLNIECEKL